MTKTTDLWKLEALGLVKMRNRNENRSLVFFLPKNNKMKTSSFKMKGRKDEISVFAVVFGKNKTFENG